MKNSICWYTISVVLIFLTAIYLFINSITLCFVSGNIATGIVLVVGFMAYLIYLITMFLGDETVGEETDGKEED